MLVALCVSATFVASCGRLACQVGTRMSVLVYTGIKTGLKRTPLLSSLPKRDALFESGREHHGTLCVVSDRISVICSSLFTHKITNTTFNTPTTLFSPIHQTTIMSETLTTNPSPTLPVVLSPGKVAKRSAEDDADNDDALALEQRSKRTRVDDTEEVLYFQEEQEAEGAVAQEEEAVDFAMEMLAREHEQQGIREETLQLSVAPHRESIGLQSGEFTGQICATIKARDLPQRDSFARSPIDIVVALDVSGSMRVEKLDLCKETLHLLLRELHHDDRFALISFSEDAVIEVPMQKVNERNKQQALHAIDRLSVKGRTNIASEFN